jgi:hypothetical protein
LIHIIGCPSYTITYIVENPCVCKPHCYYLVVEVAKETAVVIFDGIVTGDNAMRGENLTNNWIQKDN